MIRFYLVSSRYVFSYHPFFFLFFHSARMVFYVSSGYYFWNVNRTFQRDICQKMFKVAFKDVSTKNSEPTYWTILFVMLKIYFIYKVAGKKSRRAISNLTMSSASQTPSSSCHVTVMGSLIVLVNKRADWNVSVSYI
jgi:hypothetical protein